MNIVIAEINHETNTFSKLPTNIGDFKNRYFVLDNDIVDHFKGTNSVIGGFIEVLKNNNISPICTVAAAAAPSGIVSAEAFEGLNNLLINRISEQSNVDGVLLSLHGAMVSEKYPSADAEIVQRIRNEIGNEVPIIVVLDLHGNIDPKLCELVDGAIACKTYPHVDFYEMGKKAAHLILEFNDKDFNTEVFYKKIPVVFPLTNQRTALPWFSEIEKSCSEITQSCPEIYDISILFGFYFSDTEHLGVTVIFTLTSSGNNPEKYLKQLSLSLSDKIASIDYEVLSVDRLVEVLDENPTKRFAIADVTDNPGAGAQGNNIAILNEFLKNNKKNAIFSGLFFPNQVQAIKNEKIGDTVSIILEDDSGNTINSEAKILAKHNGSYRLSGEYDRGCLANYGDSVLVDLSGCAVLLHSVRHQCLDPAMLTSIGVNINDYSVFVLKSSVHFRAAFSGLVDIILEVDSGGEITCNPKSIQYQNAVVEKIGPF